jgi:hypothetical protein
VLLLDSGGYESSRISRYAPNQQQERWTFDKYAKIASEDIYDFIFSYDYFLDDNESSSAFLARIKQNFRDHSNVLDITKLIPVIHLQTLDGERTFTDDEVVALFASVATEIDCRFVAVAERELGDGLPVRAHLTQRITSAIRENASDCSLHILGCGNLLSFSALAVAGAMMCDGLEWCRTLAADNFHLHHFQQKDLFADPDYYRSNPIVEFLKEAANLNYSTSVAVRNLLSFQAFTQSLHGRLQGRTVHEFIRENFGNSAGDAIRALEP